MINRNFLDLIYVLCGIEIVINVFKFVLKFVREDGFLFFGYVKCF